MTFAGCRRRMVLLTWCIVISFCMVMLPAFTAHALTEEETVIAAKNGWHTLPDGKITYIEKKKHVKGFVELKGKWYHFDSEGYLSLGWFTEKGRRYYASKSGSVGEKKGSLVSGFKKVDGVYYQFSKKNKAGKFGTLETGWITVKKNTYYYDSDGSKLTGLSKVGGKLYYFSPSDNPKKDGVIFTGWKKIGEKQYYFREKGKIGSSYGAAYRNKTVKIDGRKCAFDKDGCLTEEEIPGTPEQKAFIEKIGKLASADMKATGVLASITVAQAIVESGFGTSTLATKAKNLFGMKAGNGKTTWKSVWKGKVYKVNTKEYINGSYVTIKDSFRKYASFEESVKDHSAYLTGAEISKGKKRYKGLKGCKDYKKAAKIIKNGGYATAPNYVSALVSVIETYHLTVYDV